MRAEEVGKSVVQEHEAEGILSDRRDGLRTGQDATLLSLI